VLQWEDTAQGLHARGRVSYLIDEVGEAYSCFLAGRDVPNARFPSIGEAKTWCERLEEKLPASKIEWLQRDEKHWTAVRPEGVEGTRYDIYYDSQFVGRSAKYSIVISKWDRADFHHDTLAAAQRQCEELDVAPSVPRDNWIPALPFD
jgi:hypothetical protein